MVRHDMILTRQLRGVLSPTLGAMCLLVHGLYRCAPPFLTQVTSIQTYAEEGRVCGRTADGVVCTCCYLACHQGVGLSGMRPPAAPLDAAQSRIRSIRRRTQPIMRLSEVAKCCVSSLSYFHSNPRVEGTAYQLLHRSTWGSSPAFLQWRGCVAR